jgi:A/G-specific adenine glycosylase
VAYVLTRGDEVALVRRPPKGLLGGMLGLPTSEWRRSPLSWEEAVEAAPAQAAWREAAQVEHVFTHFALSLAVLRAEAEGEHDALWMRDLAGLPSVFLKAARAAVAGPLL